MKIICKFALYWGKEANAILSLSFQQSVVIIISGIMKHNELKCKARDSVCRGDNCKRLRSAMRGIMTGLILLMTPAGFYAHAEDTVVANVTIEDADAVDKTDALLLFCDTNSDPTNVEKIIFEFKKYTYSSIVPIKVEYTESLDLDGVLVESVTQTFKQKPSNHFKRYYIYGPAKIKFEKSGKEKSYTDYKIQVDKRVYDYLKEILKDQLPMKETTVTESGDPEDNIDDDDYWDDF